MAKQKKKTGSEETIVAEAETTNTNHTIGESTATDAPSEPAAVEPAQAETVETEVQATPAGETAAAEDREIQPAEEATVTDEEAVQPDEIRELTEQLEEARQEAAKNLEGWQRAAAELANFKRRQEEQLKLQRDRIKSEVLEGVLTTLDDLDLAFQNLPETLDNQLVGWVEGFRLVQRKLNKVLDDQNVMVIPTDGTFDPNLHQAVSHEESEDHKEGEIIEELRKGYQIGNRVLRPSLVRVAK
jgi:molecular chaperone GrpE